MLPDPHEHTMRALNWLGFTGAGGSGLLAVATAPPSWVPILRACIACSPALCGHIRGMLKDRDDAARVRDDLARVTADNARLRREVENLKLLRDLTGGDPCDAP